MICLIRTLHGGFRGGRVWSESNKTSDGTHGATFEHMWDLKLFKSTHPIHPDTCRLSSADMKVTIRKNLNDQQFPQKFIVFTCLLASQALAKPSKRFQRIIFWSFLEACNHFINQNSGLQMKAMKASAVRKRRLATFSTSSSARAMSASLPGASSLPYQATLRITWVLISTFIGSTAWVVASTRTRITHRGWERNIALSQHKILIYNIKASESNLT